ncbi:ankyrin repeat domain-containing protein [Chachezhania antarctica]|uniref:ankyrin repeat domain-containing protein n=1 Tax=Chachezhania antarctica TaxID=2340860 RepID=UPI000EB4D2CA|nr:ankyrin repeat domain-containing protein [Chachezhania antarctica]|tara:strand:+ start:1333 stop:2832 length:1500 start_codon:yes stop_codon:yes gene_type:complete
MSNSIEQLRRGAKALRKAYKAGDAEARARVADVLSVDGDLRHADALHVIAREAGFASWPKLKFALETAVMDRAGKAARLADALYHGRGWKVEALLAETPDLGRDSLGLAVASYDVAEVRRRLAQAPEAALQSEQCRRPILHLAFSRYHQCGGAEADMLAVAETLRAAGADVNDGVPVEEGSDHRLSALYGAIGHGANMALAEWLLAQGADPNDGESLYHATEMGHARGVALLLAHGAQAEGTNALLRAMDFDDAGMVRMILETGLDPDEGIVPALPHAARRMCGAEVVSLLLTHGARAEAVWEGHSAYAWARVYGNRAMAAAMEGAGTMSPLTDIEAQLARAADGVEQPRDWIDMDPLGPEMRRLLCRLAGRDGTLAHMQRLVAMGFDANETEEMGLPPLHVAGWEGMAEPFALFLTLRPDLGHTNRFGGTVFSTILHGSANCPARKNRDHVGCMELALQQGIALPRRALDVAGETRMRDFLADWAERYPGQVVEDGIV